MANGETLPDLLLGYGIRIKRYTPGYNEPHARCPKCEGGSSGKDVSLSVTIDEDGKGATWICHRGSCGWCGGGRIASAWTPHEERRKPPTMPQRHSLGVRSNRPDWLYRFFADRHIGAKTVDAFGIYAVQRYFGEIGNRPAIVFPYVFGGEVVNRKYRPHPEKTPQQQERNALQTLFNVDRLGDAPSEIVFVEGEPDVLALYECGFTNVVSLKDGAPNSENSRNEKRFEALRTHADILSKAKKIILAVDNDDPGIALREELARRLGRHRCWLVEWPEGCKDACDVMRHPGSEALITAVKAATPYPIEGLQYVKPGTLLALRRQPPPGTMTTGARATDRLPLRLPMEGRLIVVTGIPSHGKTSWTKFVAVHTAAEHDRCWAIFSPEMQPWETFVSECAEVYSGKPFWPVPGQESMSEADILDAEAWLSDKLSLIVADSEDHVPTVDWILERARFAILRDGTTDLLIDPWNEIEHQRGELSETDYIGRCLQKLKSFALRHGCNVWIIIHPSKPQGLKPGEQRAAPGPYDCSGSSHWANKTDLGITVHSPQPGIAEVHVWKSRQRRWGQRGTVATLEFENMTGRYKTPVGEMVRDDEPVPPPRWMDFD